MEIKNLLILIVYYGFGEIINKIIEVYKYYILKKYINNINIIFFT